MPIPQINKKKPSAPQHIRDASSVRKKRARGRKGRAPKTHATTHPTHTTSTPSATKKYPTSPKGTRTKFARFKNLFTKKNLPRLLGLLLLLCFGATLIVVGGAYAWVSKDLADITDIEKRTMSQATKIYASDGQTLLYEVGDNHRDDVKLDQISEKIQWATIALEDQKFYEHKGVQLKSFARAIFRKLTGKSMNATSTLTQQLIKNAILTPEVTYTRKLKEVVLAMRLEQKYSKDEILTMYLNEVYYGANYQGVQVAARSFFEKNASDVSLAEAATIASLPQNPVILVNDPERLKTRRDYALDQMVNMGFIKQEEADAAKEEPVTIYEKVTEISAPHFVMYVRGYLEEKYGHTSLRKGGYKVITTLDWNKQQKAEQAIADGIEKVEQYGGSNAALVSIDAHTGHVVAMVGSRDWFDTENDGQVNVTTSLRQPGSSFKPLVYLTSFTQGYTPSTQLYDLETDFLTEAEGKYHPRNYDLGEQGPVTLRHALSQSLNIPAVKLLYLVGVNEALNMAEQLGYTSLRDRSRFGLSLVLGGAEVSLLEHTSSFATFAREGEYHKPVTILRVEDSEGKILEEWEDNPSQVAEEKAVRALNSVLSDSGARGYGFSGLNLSDRPAGAKTGTTNDYRDAWTLGYTPSLATGVWTGNNDNTEMKQGAAGLVIAAPIWKAYMDAVLGGTPVENFNSSNLSAKTEVLGGNLNTLKEYTVDKITNQIIPEECLDTYPEEYQEKKELKQTHAILHYLKRDDPTGSAPENPRDDPMYEPWETAVVHWTQAEERQNEYVTETTQRADCNMRSPDQQPSVKINSMDDNETYTLKDFAINARLKPGQGRTIVSVDYIIDVVTIQEQNNLNITSPYTVRSTYEPNNLTKGRHTVTVRATDDYGNTSEDTIQINYQLK